VLPDVIRNGPEPTKPTIWTGSEGIPGGIDNSMTEPIDFVQNRSIPNLSSREPIGSVWASYRGARGPLKPL